LGGRARGGMFVLQGFSVSFLQTIPPELEFDPNLTPPCYRTADSVSNDTVCQALLPC
jgi:hypothetical protein